MQPKKHQRDVPKYACDECGKLGWIGQRCRTQGCEGEPRPPVTPKMRDEMPDIERCAITILLDARARHPILANYAAYVAADPTFAMPLYQFWDIYLKELPEFASYYKEIDIYTNPGEIRKLTPLRNDNPYEAERRALNDRMAAELAGAIVNFRQHDRVKGEYPIPQHDELPYFHIELRTSFAAEIAEAIARRDAGIKYLIERWYYYD